MLRRKKQMCCREGMNTSKHTDTVRRRSLCWCAMRAWTLPDKEFRPSAETRRQTGNRQGQVTDRGRRQTEAGATRVDGGDSMWRWDPPRCKPGTLSQWRWRMPLSAGPDPGCTCWLFAWFAEGEKRGVLTLRSINPTFRFSIFLIQFSKWSSGYVQYWCGGDCECVLLGQSAPLWRPDLSEQCPSQMHPASRT